ncbi:MAG TPA: SMP-30/gluconolactonase/LRE family protein [Pseudolysinimonas sp.]|nr:SMP-30/gluconolactonase/LRE family protein [Pseudolysinimonas sp.]
MTDTPIPRVATRESFDLAEGPIWDPFRERLLWVDIRQGTVLVGRLLDDGTLTIEQRISTPATVGAVAVSAAGDWILAGQRELLTRTAAGALAAGPALLPADSGRRLNDGKVDPAGRFVVGTLMIDESPTTSEVLMLVQGDGSVDELDADLTLSNGMGWSPDGSLFYSVDSVRRVVNVRDYDAQAGTAGPRRVLITLEADRFPDGMCVDEEGFLWLAVWGGGQVRRYAPDGTFDRAIDVPAPHTSCVAFAGPGLATLVISTATKGLDARQLAEFPLSGRLFTVDAGVRGLATTPWSGHPLFLPPETLLRNSDISSAS